MTGNMSYLSDFKEFDRGYVTFGGGAKGRKVTGKRTLKTGFEDPEFPDRVYKIDKTLFIKKVKGDILLVQIYVDDIIFGSTKKKLCTEFEKLMHKKF
ncbi:hypothetical protein Tco_0069559 [Tanacetum coccineum]